MEPKIKEHKIMAMEREKRERIINAAMKEFSKGYKKASTDNIVKEAGISKGLLYHYFGTKKEVLFFVYEYAIQIIMKELSEKLDLKETDYFERVWTIMLDKLNLTYKYPSVFEFMTFIYLSDEEEFLILNKELKKIQDQQWQLSDEKMFAGVNFALFKEEEDVKKVTEIVRWTLEGYSEKLLMKYPTVKEYQLQQDEILEDIKEYMHFFKKTFYKDEKIN